MAGLIHRFAFVVHRSGEVFGVPRVALQLLDLLVGPAKISEFVTGFVVTFLTGFLSTLLKLALCLDDNIDVPEV
ncbi:hypothetical protein [Halobacterium sp. KA-6]|uniref:hypothetical protein n=1 Tax=Halobacterium sp. KA-6 TaxID=2896368 RepID=UPI001E4D8A27|nr:hypothetical protein [Halobacterium sp. KA-6]MCD2202684.1 hypothetical protein [Halobacterium sp. KA-6]